MRREASSPESTGCDRSWPERIGELERLQVLLGEAVEAVLATDPLLKPGRRTLFGGCFVTSGRGLAGSGQAGDPVWAAAVVWEHAAFSPVRGRRTDRHLRGARVGPQRSPRQADDVVGQAVVTGEARAPYRPGFLAARDGAVLAEALAALETRPDVLIVDASGLDHPRRAGLAVQLGAMTGLPTVGVTRRPLLASGPLPEPRRGARRPLMLDGRCVAYWVSTRDGARPLVAHAGWTTSPEAAADVVLESSTPMARTPVPLQEARRVAREARSLAEGN